MNSSELKVEEVLRSETKSITKVHIVHVGDITQQVFFYTRDVHIVYYS